MVASGDNFDDLHDEEGRGPLLPPEDRLWRHPSEVEGSTGVLSSEQAIAARRRWLVSIPSRAGAGTAGLVGAILAAGVVLMGIHLTSWLDTSHAHAAVAHPAENFEVESTETTLPSLNSTALTPLLARVNAALVEVRAASAHSVTEADGAIISSGGYVLAPAAVTLGATSISVITSTGAELIATVVGTDSATGLSVLNVEGSGLPWIGFSSAKQDPAGSFVLAAWKDPALQLSLGSVPSDPTPTSISNGPALLSLCPSSMHLGEAPVGALIVDGNGRLSGIVSSRKGGDAVSTPGWLAAHVAAEIIASGHVIHGWLGIEGRATKVPAELTDKTGALAGRATATSSGAMQAGVQVLAVEPHSAAAKAGLKQGDVIESVNGEHVATMADLQAVLYLMTPQSAVKLDVVRGSRLSEMSTRLQAAA